MEDDDIAFRLVELYVKDVSKGHEKRQMGLDTILNAYFYALLRIQRKAREMQALEAAVEKEEELLEGKAASYQPSEQQETIHFQKEEKPGQSEFQFD
jgi:hypothetical protein